MRYIDFPDTTIRRLSFYLATEEFLARHTAIEECFFMWQVRPTVIFGRNQLIENEVNLPYCQAHGIETYRRKSGGGCVYADQNNIMFSYINSGQSVTLTFDRYINMVVALLQKLGLPAYTSGRNDILIEGKKVSGNAFYHLPGRNIVHGTMLFDTNWQNMVGSITPSEKKLVSKGVESVRQHVTVLKDYLTIDIETFKRFVREELCGDLPPFTLTTDDLEQISTMEREYLDPTYTLGHNPRYTLRRHRRIEGCGEFAVALELKNNIIKGLDLKGDFFLTGDLSALLNRLYHRPLTADALCQALDGIDVGQYIVGLDRAAFVDLLLDRCTSPTPHIV